MKKLKALLICTLTILIVSHSQAKQTTDTIQESDTFSFVFITDIHLTEEYNAVEGFSRAIDTINKLAPDFVLTGGDNIMDALAQTYEKSDSAFQLFSSTIKKLNMPVYSTIGNHDIFGLYPKSGVDPSHPEYGKNFYEKRIAKRYYSFDHKNWHFVVLDGIGFTDDRHYFGHVDD